MANSDFAMFDLEARAQPLDLPLYAALRSRRRPWWRRLLGREESLAEVAHLVADARTLRTRASNSTPEIDLTRPFHMHLSWWPYEGEGHGELTLSLVQQGGREAIRVRTLWLREAVSDEVQRQQSQDPFLDPESFASLWRTLSRYVAAHGLEVPRGLSLEVEPNVLRSLNSQGEAPYCIACGNYRLTLTGPGAYRCMSCGYEGGDGLAAQKEAQRRATLSSEPVDVREPAALRDLFEAERLLTTARSALSDLNGALADDRSFDVRDAEFLLSARRLLRDACYRAHWVDEVLGEVLDARDLAWDASLDGDERSAMARQVQDLELLGDALERLFSMARIEQHAIVRDHTQAPLAIPDNDPAGIDDLLICTEEGRVVEVFALV
ncbi:MAG: hypothetical protein AAFS10_22450, partial [Myxococcota bacterium]